MMNIQKSLVTLGILMVVATSMCLTAGSDSILTVGYYRDGQEITTGTYAVIGDVEGVTDITLSAKITNTGEMPLVCSIVDSSPEAYTTAVYGLSSIDVPVGGSNETVSNLIPVNQFVGTSPTFFVMVDCLYQYAGQTSTLTKEGFVTIPSVEPDPIAGFDLEIGSSVGTSGAGAEPDPTPDPDPTCLTSGSTCSVSSECCSNSCLSTMMTVVTMRCPVYEGSCTLAGNCPNVEGCQMEGISTGGDVMGQPWTYLYDVPYGDFSFTVNANNPTLGSTDTTYRIVYGSGACT